MASKFNWYTPEEWTEMWIEDKKHMVVIMINNMTADLNAGYDINGDSIKRQREEIANYEADYQKKMMGFAAMDEKTAGRWCFYDMKRRGVID